jgi:hypothetical protein
MHKKYILTLIIIIVLSTFINCRSKKIDKKEAVITFQIKENIKETYNKNKTLLLILRSKADGNLPITFNYKVVDSKMKKVLKKGIFVGEKMEWLDAKRLKCTKHVGMIQKEDDQILSQETKKKTATNYNIIDIN